MYAVPDASDQTGPYAICARLVRDYPEFDHLKEGDARIEFLLCGVETLRGGRQVLGEVHLPTVQGRLKGVFDWLLLRLFEETPDFLVVLDQAYWDEADGRQREILVFHELCHCVQKSDKQGEPRFDEEGRPVWGLMGHDVEEFTATVSRYGAYSPEIVEFIQAAGKASPRVVSD